MNHDHDRPSLGARGVLKTKVRHIHFVGIGGVGMSGIAEVLLTLGFSVSGSDISESKTVQRLRQFGARVEVGHRAENIRQTDVLVYSSAIDPATNPEVVAARKNGAPIIPRAEMLAELMRLKEGILVGGSHGKTTTSSLVSWVLSEAGLDPTCIIGGRVESFDSNARLGESRFIVAEADESDGSFLKLFPVMNVITNIDPEHLDHYKTFEALQDAFVQFANLVPFYGANVVCTDHPIVRKILPRVSRRIISYGFNPEARFRATDIRPGSLGSRFVAWRDEERLGEVHVPMPGHHNVLNATAVIAVASELEIPFSTMAQALSTFRGIDRRFQVKGVVDGVTVVDDYGHHPEEIRATLRAARENFSGRVVVLFQPHRYTRTQNLFGEFTQAFGDASDLLVTEIYAASEKPIAGVTGKALADAIRNVGHPSVGYAKDKREAALQALRLLKPGDVAITLGAGDIKDAGPYLIELLNASKGDRT